MDAMRSSVRLCNGKPEVPDEQEGSAGGLEKSWKMIHTSRWYLRKGIIIDGCRPASTYHWDLYSVIPT